MKKVPDNYDLDCIPTKRREKLIKKWEVEKAANERKFLKARAERKTRFVANKVSLEEGMRIANEIKKKNPLTIKILEKS